MGQKLAIHVLLEIAFILTVLAPSALGQTDVNDPNRYLNAVREFADNVLKYGRDTYGPKHTPLFVDGVNIHTHEPVKWIAPNGDRWILSNLASQQNLFRTLDGLSKMTGDPKYRQAAMNAIEYAFANLRSPNGLLYWGVYTAYDAQGDKVVPEDSVHILKANLPYYELMWQVNPEATKRLIESFWSAHIKDWRHLDMDRIGHYDDTLEEPWNHKYEEGPIYLESGGGIPFLNAGTDLLYAAAMLTKLSGDKEPLVWAKRLAYRYVRTRHPKTGISYYIYKKPSFTMRDSYDSVTRKIEGEETNSHFIDMFPWTPYILGEKSAEEYKRGQLSGEYRRGIFTPTPGMPVNQPVSYWQAQFLLGEMLAGEGDEFKQWPLEELTAFGKATYRKKDNVYVPILTDGTSLDGYVVQEEGTFFGPKGGILQPAPVWPSDLWAYAMGYRVTKDAFMWEMACNIAKGNEFGDIGAKPEDKTQLDIVTDCANPYALLAFLELYRATEKTELLNIAKRIGDNILDSRFHKGFFVISREHIYTKFDAIDSLALLQLHSALAGGAVEIPQAWPHSSNFNSPYRLRGYFIDNDILYTRTDPSELPLTLQEAAVSGDIALVRSLVDGGADLEFSDDGNKTALQSAAVNGHKEIVELLLAKGARIDAQESWPGRTALDYAVEKGHKDIVELLINKGADVNAKITEFPKGDTPLLTAVKTAHKDIVELLISKGADVNAKGHRGGVPIDIAMSQGRMDIASVLIDNGAEASFLTKLRVSMARQAAEEQKAKEKQAEEKKSSSELPVKAAELSIHVAAQSGDQERVEALLDRGIDIDAKDSEGNTSLFYAAFEKHEALAVFLIEQGADVNAKGAQGMTPLFWAAAHGLHKLAEVLVTNEDIDVNVLNYIEWTPLHISAFHGRKGIVQLLVAHGADITVKDSRGRTALQLAEQRGHAEIVDLITKQKPVRDVVITNISAPASCFQGDATAVGIDLENRGNNGLSFQLVLTDVTDARGIGSLSIMLSEIGKNGRDVIADVIFDAESKETQAFGQSPIVGDVNGDGYDDILLPSPQWNGRRGRAYLYLGSKGIIDPKKPDLVLIGENVGDLFGADCDMGDVNGDGYDDIVIGALGYNNGNSVPIHQDRGRAYLFYGGPTIDSEADVVFDGEEGTTGGFGRKIDIGFVDRDSYADILINANYYDNDRGRAYLFYGGNPIDTIPDKIFDGENANDRMGREQYMGKDVNGDGYGDIIFGARAYGRDRGRVYLFYGGPKEGMDTMCDKVFSGENDGDQFGSSVCLGDIDRDGCAEVIIGARKYAENACDGRIYLYWGEVNIDADRPDKVFEEAPKASLGGDRIRCGDFNDDQYKDIVVAAYDYPNYLKLGRVYLYYGNEKSSMDTTADQCFTGHSPQSLYGYKLDVGDCNGDGYDDLVVGAPWHPNGEEIGRAYLYYGPFEHTHDVSFKWDTTNASVGTHTLKVEVPPVPGEQNTDDNVKTVIIEVKGAGR